MEIIDYCNYDFDWISYFVFRYYEALGVSSVASVPEIKQAAAAA